MPWLPFTPEQNHQQKGNSGGRFVAQRLSTGQQNDSGLLMQELQQRWQALCRLAQGIQQCEDPDRRHFTLEATRPNPTQPNSTRPNQTQPDPTRPDPNMGCPGAASPEALRTCSSGQAPRRGANAPRRLFAGKLLRGFLPDFPASPASLPNQTRPDQARPDPTHQSIRLTKRPGLDPR